MSSEEEIKTALAKLKKDELYTFLAGFGLGLVYFLILATNSTTCPLGFYIENNFYITLFLLMFWLLSTLILYLNYHLICWPAYSHAIKKAKESLNKATPVVETMNYKAYEDYLASYPHLFGIICSTLLLLTLAPWLLKARHNFFQTNFWPIAIDIGLIIGAALFYKFALWPHLRDTAITNEKIERRLIILQ